MASCERPNFSAYKFVNVHRQANKIKTTKKNPTKDQELEISSSLTDGVFISLNITSEIFSNGCVLVGHASGSMSI